METTGVKSICSVNVFPNVVAAHLAIKVVDCTPQHTLVEASEIMEPITTSPLRNFNNKITNDGWYGKTRNYIPFPVEREDGRVDYFCATCNGWRWHGVFTDDGMVVFLTEHLGTHVTRWVHNKGDEKLHMLSIPNAVFGEGESNTYVVIPGECSAMSPFDYLAEVFNNSLPHHLTNPTMVEFSKNIEALLTNYPNEVPDLVSSVFDKNVPTHWVEFKAELGEMAALNNAVVDEAFIGVTSCIRELPTIIVTTEEHHPGLAGLFESVVNLGSRWKFAKDVLLPLQKNGKLTIYSNDKPLVDAPTWTRDEEYNELSALLTIDITELAISEWMQLSNLEATPLNSVDSITVAPDKYVLIVTDDYILLTADEEVVIPTSDLIGE